VVLTSYLVASDNFNFFMTRFRATLRGFLGGTGKLSSRLDGFSVSEMCGVPVQQNLERSWNHCCSVSSSSLFEVSSMTTTLSPFDQLVFDLDL
jgi:hypothetical protein